jgi:hypothetical protein
MIVDKLHDIGNSFKEFQFVIVWWHLICIHELNLPGEKASTSFEMLKISGNIKLKLSKAETDFENKV